MEQFYIGLHQPHDAVHFARACISVNRLRTRRKPLTCNLLLDSGAFTELAAHGRYRTEPEDYARTILRLADIAPLDAAVTQDWMCEPFMLAKTGKTVREHQALTIERYDALRVLCPDLPLMPVLQGYAPSDYVEHIHQYGRRLGLGQWTGVGSVCKRNAHPDAVRAVLTAITEYRPDLRLHGFGVKTTSLADPHIRSLLWSADSMAWSYAARREGRGQQANDWREAQAFLDKIENRLGG